MADWIDSLIAESVSQYIVNWRLMATSTPRGQVFGSEGLSFAIAALHVPLFNLAMLNRPAASFQEAGHFARQAIAEFRRSGVPGTLTGPASWFPDGSRAELESLGLRRVYSLMGMRTARLNDPTRHLNCEVRELDGDSAVEPLARINGLAYGMDSSEWSELRLPGFWSSGPRAYAVFEKDEPVAVGAAATSDSVSYLMWMATIPKARRRGYAEAIIRRAWNDARRRDGARFTALHATEMGRPVYAGLGYVAVADFPTFIWTGD